MTEIFDTAYQSLFDEGTRRLYRLLSLHRGPDIAADAAAALADTIPEAAAHRLQELADAHLLNEEQGGRYSFHDLLREHAHATAEKHRDRDDLTAAFVRLAYWYLRMAAAAQRAVIPGRWYIGQVFTEPSVADFDETTGLEWLAAERYNLVSTLCSAYDQGLHAVAWQLAEAMWGLVLRHCHNSLCRTVYEFGTMAAQAAGDPVAEACMLHGEAELYLAQQSYDNAEACTSLALEIAQATGHRMAEATSHEQLGLTALGRGDDAVAEARFLVARDIYRQADDERGVGLMACHLGEVATAAEDYPRAIEHLTDAERWLANQPDERYLWSRCLGHLGRVYRLVTRPGDAETALYKALDLARTISAHQQQADVLVELADLATDLGKTDLAQRHLREAHAIYEQLSTPDAVAVAKRLDVTLETP